MNKKLAVLTVALTFAAVGLVFAQNAVMNSEEETNNTEMMNNETMNNEVMTNEAANSEGMMRAGEAAPAAAVTAPEGAVSSN